MKENVICPEWPEWPQEQNLQGFLLFHPVVPPWVPFGNREVGRKFLSYEFCLSSYFACPGNCHLFTLPVQGINSTWVSLSPIFPFTADGEHFHWCANNGYKSLHPR